MRRGLVFVLLPVLVFVWCVGWVLAWLDEE